MPKQYEAIKESYAKAHPSASEKEVKKHSAMIFIAKGKSGTRSSRAKALMGDRVRSSKGHVKNSYRKGKS